MAEQEVKLSVNGGWMHLFDVKCGVGMANYLNVLQAILLGLILWRVWQ